MQNNTKVSPEKNYAAFCILHENGFSVGIYSSGKNYVHDLAKTYIPVLESSKKVLVNKN